MAPKRTVPVQIFGQQLQPRKLSLANVDHDIVPVDYRVLDVADRLGKAAARLLALGIHVLDRLAHQPASNAWLSDR